MTRERTRTKARIIIINNIVNVFMHWYLLDDKEGVFLVLLFLLLCASLFSLKRWFVGRRPLHGEGEGEERGMQTEGRMKQEIYSNQSILSIRLLCHLILHVDQVAGHCVYIILLSNTNRQTATCSKMGQRQVLRRV